LPLKLQAIGVRSKVRCIHRELLAQFHWRCFVTQTDHEKAHASLLAINPCGRTGAPVPTPTLPMNLPPPPPPRAPPPPPGGGGGGGGVRAQVQGRNARSKFGEISPRGA